MKKTRILTALLALLVGASAASCGSSDPAPSGGDTTPPASDSADTSAADINPFEVKDFGGYECRILSISKENATPDEIWVEAETGDVLDDAIFKRNRAVEEALGIKIVQAMDGVERNTMAKTIQPLLMAGDHAFDFALCNFRCLNSILGLEGALVELNSIESLDLDADWWDPTSLDAFSIAGREYVVSGSLNLNASLALYGLLFNKALIEDLHMESPYDLVRSGSWTLDKMSKMMADAKRDLDGNSQWNDEDRYGLIATQNSIKYLFLGTGEELIAKNEEGIPAINRTERLHDAIAKVLTVGFERYQSIAYTQGEANLADFFLQNKALFFQSSLENTLSLRNMDADYGIIPAPKLDEKQENYYCPQAATRTTMLTVPAFNPDLERTGIILNAMGYYSEELVMPAFYESTLSAKGVRDEESLEMLELMNKSKFYVINEVFDFGSANNIFKNLDNSKNNDFASQLASFESAINTAIEDFLDTIGE